MEQEDLLRETAKIMSYPVLAETQHRLLSLQFNMLLSQTLLVSLPTAPIFSPNMVAKEPEQP